MKLFNKKPIILSSLLLLTLISCEIKIATNSNENDVSDNSEISNNYVSNEEESSSEFQETIVYQSSIEVKSTSGDSVNNNNFTFNNIDASVVASGVILDGNDSFILGSGIETGSLTFKFNTPITIDQIDFDVFAYFSNSTTTTFYYNESSTLELKLDKSKSVGYRFSNPVSISSMKFESKGIGGRIEFKKISFSLHEKIAVTGIEAIKEKEVFVNDEFLINDCYSVLPSNAYNKNVDYSFTSNSIVYENNKFKCLEEGTYYITVTTEDGGFNCEVKIIATKETIPECAEKITRENTRFTYDSIFKSSGTEGLVPSVGSPNIIVVPVNFSDLLSVYDFNDDVSLSRLEAAFNGNKADYTNDYSHSLRSYYRESSYGLLDMNFIISDVFVPSFSSSSFVSKENQYDGGGTYALLEEFYNKGKIDGSKINFKDSKYDINNDGFVDGIWLVYNDNRSSTTDNYWPYTYWYYALDDEGYIIESDMNISCYANCSVYFTYEDSYIGQDYHTLVHETGHMLGLDDYYVTDSTSTMSAIGGLDMMDYNIGDHNAFSKFALNWVEPYLLNNEGSITLKPFESSGDCLIVPSSYFNDSAFSEYLIFEYYTPTGINELDSKNAYPGRDNYFTKNGIRVFHVDARMVRLDYSSSKGYYFSGSYLDESATSLSTSNYSFYQVGASNTPSYSYNGYHLIEAVTADNTSTYKKSSTDNDSLFVEGDVFNPSIYSSFFTNGKLHDGVAISYKFEFTSMTSEGCRITITKK